MRITMAVLVLVAALACATSASAVEGNFLLSCPYDHTAKDDPIVSPGVPGAAHLHSFFAVPNITAFSTTADLVGRPTRCVIGGETVSVWHPSVIKPDGTVVNPVEVSIYYRNNEAPDRPVYPFPMGLRFVQGDSHNTSPSRYAATYRCYSGGVNYVYLPASCGGSGFEESIYVPSCWKGESINPPDHHPLVTCTGAADEIRMPQIQFLVQWPGAAEGGKLSSDIDAGAAPGLTGHIDYWFGADPFVFAKIVERCLNAGIQCRVNGPGESNPQGTVYNNSASYPKPAVLSASEARGLVR